MQPATLMTERLNICVTRAVGGCVLKYPWTQGTESQASLARLKPLPALCSAPSRGKLVKGRRVPKWKVEAHKNTSEVLSSLLTPAPCEEVPMCFYVSGWRSALRWRGKPSFRGMAGIKVDIEQNSFQRCLIIHVWRFVVRTARRVHLHSTFQKKQKTKQGHLRSLKKTWRRDGTRQYKQEKKDESVWKCKIKVKNKLK